MGVNKGINAWIGTDNNRWAFRDFVWVLVTSSWIAIIKMTSSVLSPALKAPFVSASLYPACHVITAAIFPDWAVAFGTILVVLV